MTVAPTVFSRPSARDRADLSYAILSTYPPTACGLATFSAALSAGLASIGATVGVVRVADGSRTPHRVVLAELENGSAASVQAATETLNQSDVAIIQHEYGVYGGADGDEVLDILHGLTVPSIVIAHTVLLEPTDHQRRILEEVVDVAGAVVVMTDAARHRLCTLFDIDESKVMTIAHGATVPDRSAQHEDGNRPTLLTWGLIGEGKGIEWAIDALVSLRDLHPRPRYVIAGRTHPKVRALEGEHYRDMLIRRSWARGVAASVIFDDSYRDVPSLTQLIQRSSVVVLPYDSRDQVTSGVLVDAVAAGRPVVATAFPHAVELLSNGAGIVVPHRNPAALAFALRRVLTEPGLMDHMSEKARELAPDLSWVSVAGEYAELAGQLCSATAAVR